MNSLPTNQSEHVPSAETASLAAKRRRRLLLGGASAPLLLTIASRPAWAGGDVCTASALASANLSGQHTHAGCSKSAGFWKQKPQHWPTGPNVYFNTSSSFVSVFGNVNIPAGNTGKAKGGVVETVNFGSLSLLEVMHLKGKDDPYQVGFHTVGALVNAHAFPTLHPNNPGFSLTPEQVVTMFQSIATGTDPKVVAKVFEDANNEFNNWNP